MKKKTVSFFVGLIALRLIVAAVAGTVSLMRKIDRVDTVEASTGDKFETELYIDEENQSGYRTFYGVTYFFKVITMPYEYNKYALISLANTSYGGYSPYCKYSHDTISWYQPEVSTNLEGDVYNYGYDAVYGEPSYFCYARIANCTDPKGVLADLNENFFSNNELFSVSYIEPV